MPKQSLTSVPPVRSGVPKRGIYNISGAGILRGSREGRTVNHPNNQEICDIQGMVDDSVRGMSIERSPEPLEEVNPLSVKGERTMFAVMSGVPHVKRGRSSCSSATAMDTMSDNQLALADSTGNRTIEIRCLVSRVQASLVPGAMLSSQDSGNGSSFTCRISNSLKGAGERVLMTRGTASDVSKHLAELVDIWSVIGSSADNGHSRVGSGEHSLRVLFPEALIASLVNNGDCVREEIEESSAARITICKTCLPWSTERLVSIQGPRDAIHIATYYLSSYLIQQFMERFGDTNASAYGTVSGKPASHLINKLLVVPYSPESLCGSYGNPATKKKIPVSVISSNQPCTGLGLMQVAQDRINNANENDYNTWGDGYISAPSASLYQAPVGFKQEAHPSLQCYQWQPGEGQPKASRVQVQQIYIPNDMVGSIIGKAGARIKELRSLSGSVIQIGSDDGGSLRLLTVMGTEENIAIAMVMLQMILEGGGRRV